MSTNYTEIAKLLRDKDCFLKKDLIEFKCEGTSMNPVLKAGDEILVRRIPLSCLCFGDVITYEENGTFITHRFLYSRSKKNQTMMVTKADNRLKLDKPVTPLFLLGKVVGISRNGQRIEMETKWWYFSSRLIALLSLMEGQLFEIFLSLKKVAKMALFFSGIRCK